MWTAETRLRDGVVVEQRVGRIVCDEMETLAYYACPGFDNRDFDTLKNVVFPQLKALMRVRGETGRLLLHNKIRSQLKRWEKQHLKQQSAV